MRDNQETLILGHQNCITLILTNILHSEIDDYRKVWKQLGLMTYYDSGKLRIYPRYRSLKSELEFGSNIILREHSCETEKGFKLLLEYLLNTQRVIVPVDAYYLHYCLNYHNEHDFHFIEICKRPVNGSYEIYDPMFRYKGEFSEADLNKAIIEGKRLESNDPNENYALLYIDTSDYQQLGHEDLMGIIEQNTIAMKDEKQKDIEKFYGTAIPEQKPFHTGLSVFKDIIKIFKDNNCINGNLVNLEDIYMDFKEIANSRYIYSSFLEVHKDEEYHNKSLKKISDIYFDLGHQWDVTANMILKLTVSKKESIIPRILKKIEVLQEQETQVIENLISTNELRR